MGLEIYLARHGQNEDNLNGVLNGRRDLPLTDLGRQQGLDLAEGIKEAGLSFDRVYSSPLSRAYETAQIVCRALDIAYEPVVIPDLIERDFGIWTGKPINEAVRAAGEDIIRTEGVTYVLNFQGGETFPVTLRRAHRVLRTVRELQPEGSALLVSHGDIGKMVYAAATGRPWQDVLMHFHFGNCDLIDVNADGQAHKIKLPQHNL